MWLKIGTLIVLASCPLLGTVFVRYWTPAIKKEGRGGHVFEVPSLIQFCSLVVRIDERGAGCIGEWVAVPAIDSPRGNTVCESGTQTSMLIAQ